MKRNVSEKSLLTQKHKKKIGSDDQSTNKNRFLATINVLGSAGPIRFVVKKDDLVSGVIQTALKTYAREGRLPVLSTDVNYFVLHAAADSDDPASKQRYDETFYFFCESPTNSCGFSSLTLEPIGSHRISGRKELRAVQETDSATDDGSQIRDDIAQEKRELEGMAQQEL